MHPIFIKSSAVFVLHYLQFPRTLVSTASLSLLPLSNMPTYWSYDQAMSLYPLPNLIVAADTYFPYTEQYASCTVVNPVSTYPTHGNFYSELMFAISLMAIS